MSTTEERISILYGTDESSADKSSGTALTDTAPAKVIEQQATAELDPVVQALYPTEDKLPNGNPYAINLDDADRNLDSLYGATNRVEIAGDTDLSIIADGNPGAEENLRTNLGYIAGDVGLDGSQLDSIVSAANEALITGDIPDAKETLKSLYAEHGADLNSKLSKAQALVASFPEVFDYLDRTGLGNHPKIVRQIIAAAEHPRAEARMRKFNQLLKGGLKK